MGHHSDQDALVAAAEAALGGPVLAAGIFGWQDLVRAQVAGGTVGALAGGTLGGTGSALGAAVGGRAAKEVIAEANDLTLELLVVVTESAIDLFNFADGQAGRHVGSWSRETTEVKVDHLGLSRVVHLDDTASGHRITLHATVAPFRPQSRADKAVLDLLESH